MRHFVGLLVVACAACSSGTAFRIDNPTDHSLDVTIDGTKHTIAAGADERVKLAPGKHTVSAPAIGTVNFIAYKGDRSVLMNVELADYVIAGAVYKTGMAKTTFAPLASDIYFDGLRYRGAFTLANDLFIPETWHYGLHEDFPETETVSADTGGNIYTKVFTKQAFIQFYRANFGAPENAPEVPMADLAARKARALSPPPSLPVFENPEIQRASMPLREAYDRYCTATDPATQAKILDGKIALIQTLVGVYATQAAHQPVSENQKYNDFIMQVGNTIGAQALVSKD